MTTLYILQDEGWTVALRALAAASLHLSLRFTRAFS